MTLYFVIQTPSLRHLALVKILTCLWNHRHLFARMTILFHHQPDHGLFTCREEWKALEGEVKRNVLALPLPKPCQKQLLPFIRPLGAHIVHWCAYQYNDTGHMQIQYLEDFSPRRLCWTMHGVIDYAKTAKSMLKDWTVDVSKRYELACINCLESQARELIPFISESRRRKYIDEGIGQYVSQRLLIVYFTCVLSGKVGQLSRKLCQTRFFRARFSPGDSVDKWFLEAMAGNDNRAAWEYFFNKLSLLERDQVFANFQRDGYHQRSFHICSFMYYLQQMSEEQREGIFRERMYEVLNCLLHWPHQSLFMEAAERGWSYMDEHSCTELLYSIVLKIVDGHKGYSELFWGCWFLSSTEYKKYYVVNTHYGESLLREKIYEFLKLILNEAPASEIEGLYDTFSELLVEKYAISETALKQCRRKAILNSVNEPRDEEKRAKTQILTRLIDSVMEIRINKRREKKKLERQRYNY